MVYLSLASARVTLQKASWSGPQSLTRRPRNMTQTNEARRRILAAIDQYRTNESVQECLESSDDCSGRIVRAHSVQSSRVLGSLARDGHVYMFRGTDTGAALKLVGVNKATTFSGFCMRHDTDLFRDIDLSDTVSFDPNSKRQLTLFALRATAREYWVKLNVIRLYDRMNLLTEEDDFDGLARFLNLGREDVPVIEANHSFIGQYLTTLKESQGRLEKCTGSLRTQINRYKYHTYRHVVFRFAGAPSVAASSVFTPEFDLSGNRVTALQGFEDIPDMCLSVFPLDSSSWVLLSFHKRYDRLSEMIRQIQTLEASAAKTSHKPDPDCPL